MELLHKQTYRWQIIRRLNGVKSSDRHFTYIHERIKTIELFVYWFILLVFLLMTLKIYIIYIIDSCLNNNNCNNISVSLGMQSVDNCDSLNNLFRWNKIVSLTIPSSAQNGVEVMERGEACIRCEWEWVCSSQPGLLSPLLPSPHTFSRLFCPAAGVRVLCRFFFCFVEYFPHFISPIVLLLLRWNIMIEKTNRKGMEEPWFLICREFKT